MILQPPSVSTQYAHLLYTSQPRAFFAAYIFLIYSTHLSTLMVQLSHSSTNSAITHRYPPSVLLALCTCRYSICSAHKTPYNMFPTYCASPKPVQTVPDWTNQSVDVSSSISRRANYLASL